MKADGGQALSELHTEMEKMLRLEGFSHERKSFFPHVTLLRDVPFHKSQELPLPNERRVSVNVTKVVLFESVNGPQGLVYKVVAAS
jgi:2'-5' RNA ligase